MKLPNNLSKTNHQMNLINKLESDEERKNIIVYECKTRHDVTSLNPKPSPVQSPLAGCGGARL